VRGWLILQVFDYQRASNSLLSRIGADLRESLSDLIGPRDEMLRGWVLRFESIRR
jgi:hypothetical protein